MAIVFYFGLFMKHTSNAMTTQITHDTKSVGMRMLLYCVSYVTNKYVGSTAYMFADLKAFPRHIHKFLFLFCCSTYNKHSTGISIISIKNCSAINVDNISFLQNNIVRWNTMTYNLVNACTARFWKTFIIQWSRNTSMSHSKFMYETIYFSRTHTFLYSFCDIIKYCRIQCTCPTYTFNLFW